MKKNYLLFGFLFFLNFTSNGQVENGLVAYYPFKSGKAEDVTNRGGDGEIYGRLQIVQGIKGDAIYFDGGDHNIVFEGRVNRYLRGKNDFSISFYFQSDDPQRRASLIGKRRLCKGVQMLDLRTSKGYLEAELHERERPPIRNNVRAKIPDQEWHHYVYIRRSNSVKIFIDGVLEDRNQISRIIPIDDQTYFSINASPCKKVDGTQNLKGSLDELKIYNRALTSREVEKLFEKYDRPATAYREKESKQDYKNNSRKSTSGKPDPRLESIFGNYEDKDSRSQFTLDPKQFILKIEEPGEYGYDEITYTGKYKIEAGELHLLEGEVVMKNRTGDVEKRIPYKVKIIGELYENGIDLFAFETRMKLKK